MGKPAGKPVSSNNEPKILDQAISNKASSPGTPSGGQSIKSGMPASKEVHYKVSNGQAVGSMHLGTTGKEPERKLSAGTDLIEDIPYILHRRLDGKKQETAVFKVSEAEKLKKESIKSQRQQQPASSSVTPGAVPATTTAPTNSTAVVKKPTTFPVQLRKKHAIDSKKDNVKTPQKTNTPSPRNSGVTSCRSKSPLDRSPSLTRRLEFVHMHTLPSRNSYSSVDDTTSPSTEHAMPRQLDVSAGAKSDSAAKTPGDQPVETKVQSQIEGDEDSVSSEGQVERNSRCAKREAKKDPNRSDQTLTEENAKPVIGLANVNVNDDQLKQLASDPVEIIDHSNTPNEEVKDSELKGIVEEKARSAIDIINNKEKSVPLETEIDLISTEMAVSGHSVEKPLAVKKTSHNGDEVLNLEVSKSPVNVKSKGVNMKSPLIPETKTFRKLTSSISDESPDSPSYSAHPGSSEKLPTDQKDDNKANSTVSGCNFFEVAKPHVQNRKAVVIDNMNVFPLPASDAQDVSKDVMEVDNVIRSDNANLGAPDDRKAEDHHMESSEPEIISSVNENTISGSFQPQTLQVDVSELTTSHDNQFLMDLPSPAAALFYGDNDNSPPQTAAVVESVTFSTFRPDPSEEGLLSREETSGKESKSKLNRWSLHSVQESEEEIDYKVIVSEGAGIVEKSALKKRRKNDGDKPREPKRVSWHEDGDVQHSYLSDVSMTALRSPVDDYDSSAYSGSNTPVDSRDILETLETLRRQNSESDMTNSGSSLSSSDESDGDDDEVTAREVYLRYAESKGLNLSVPSSEGTVDSGVGANSDCHDRQRSPLHSLDRGSPMISSMGSVGCDRFYLEEHNIAKHTDCSPLETLEQLSELSIDDHFDDDDADGDDGGEVGDDEDDDEPNYPPPPPIMEIPDDMMVSYESDQVLPPYRHPSQDPLECLEGATASARSSLNVGSYSSDSDNEVRLGASGWRPNRASIDPLAVLEIGGDLMGGFHCTTSESESDFDADEANVKLRFQSGLIPSGLRVVEASATSPPQLPQNKSQTQPQQQTQSLAHSKMETKVQSTSHGDNVISGDNSASKRSPRPGSIGISGRKGPPPPVRKKAPKVMAKPNSYPSQMQQQQQAVLHSQHHHHQQQHPVTSMSPRSHGQWSATGQSHSQGIRHAQGHSSDSVQGHSMQTRKKCDSSSSNSSTRVGGAYSKFAASTPTTTAIHRLPSTPSEMQKSSPSPTSPSLQHPLRHASSPNGSQFKTPMRQPQMGVAMHYDRKRHESGSPRLSSTSSTSSSESRSWKHGHS